MKKISKQISILILCLIITFCFSFSYAGANSALDEKAVVREISNSVLNILSWFAYAVALGIVIFIGIKYVLSGANEKADLKSLLPKYLIGIALIIMCFGIAQAVANIAGNDTAEEIIGVGANPGGTGNATSNGDTGKGESTTHETASENTMGGSYGSF